MELKRIIVVLIGFGMLFFSTQAAAELLNPPTQAKPAEAPEDERVKVAEKGLTGKTDVVMLYAEGLCCPSCAIGIRKKLSVLDFVDTSGSNQGVDLDPKFQLVTLNIKKEKALDAKKLAMAIDDAGYTPVRLYQMEKGKLVTTKLAVN